MTADRTQVQLRGVFADPVTNRTAAVILAHNHPVSGVEPNKEDITVTERLREVDETLGIRLPEQIIFNQRGYSSLKEGGQI